jgi:peptidoglycan/xylan/chitin deacetylase (PgdA/CDA1 family)
MGSEVDRRVLLAGLAASVSAALLGCGSGAARPAGTGTGSSTVPSSGPSSASSSAPRTPSIGVAAPMFGPPTGLARRPVPRGTVDRLPGTGRAIALTIDDGTDSSVVGAYAELCRVTGLRATFFCNGVNPAWTEHALALRALLDDGRIFLANHTWSHADLVRLDAAAVADQVRRNETFLKDTFGVTGRPFLRPPFGYHNARLDRQLADLGYPAVTMWFGTLGDATVETPQKIVAMAEQWFQPQRVVIGHANYPPVVDVLDRLVGIIQERDLQPVHLGDVYATTG